MSAIIKRIFLLATSFLLILFILNAPYFCRGGMETTFSTGPICNWSAESGDTLVGPYAPLSVSWTGEGYGIVNNTLEFETGMSVYNQSGKFTDNSSVDAGYDPFDPDYVYQAYIPAGTYYCELWWNDRAADLDGYIFTSDSFEIQDSILPFGALATLSCPETGFATFPYSGEYWFVVDWFGGRFPLDFWFFIGSEDYFFYKNQTSGADQTFNTGVLPDRTYQVNATCYDSEGNLYSDTKTFTTLNQFPPAIDWVKVNGKDVNNTPLSGLSFERGTEITIEWQAADPNAQDRIFTTLHYKKPKLYRYSLVFSSLIVSNYTINWDLSLFNTDGQYTFKIEVMNENGVIISDGRIEFIIYIGPSSGDEGNKSVPAFTAVNLFLPLLISVMYRQKKK